MIKITNTSRIASKYYKEILFPQTHGYIQKKLIFQRGKQKTDTVNFPEINLKKWSSCIFF